MKEQAISYAQASILTSRTKPSSKGEMKNERGKM
jgi:hypothetical protein